uniref:Uncharacterized protein n=1 Tax=Rhizophora mucronata TaxID=61149 RepID=A0A2P2N2X3_RHIMU
MLKLIIRLIWVYKYRHKKN